MADNVLGTALIPIRATLKDLDRDLSKAKNKVDNVLGKTLFAAGAAGAVALGAALAGIAVVGKAGLDSLKDWGEQVDKLTDQFGMSAESASVWAVAMARYGVPVDEVAASLNILTRNLANLDQESASGAPKINNATRALAELGITATDSSGNLRSIDDLLPEIMQRFSELPDGIEKSNVALELFGKSGDKMLDFLNQGKQGLKEAEQYARMFGLVMSTEAKDAVEQFGFSMNTLDLAFQGLKTQIGLFLLPIAQEVITTATGVVAGITGAFTDPSNKNAITTLQNDIISGLSSIANRALDWGTNIMVSLANGLAWGLGAVADVMVGLGNILSFFLEAHSPPRIAPDLEEWGKNAMLAYMQGWGDADFSAFDTLSREIADSLNADVILGKIKQIDVIPTLLGSRAVIAEALDELKRTGDISQETFDRVIASAGAAGEQVRALLQSYIGLQKATTALSQADDKYARAQESVEKAEADLAAIKPINYKGYEEYQAALRQAQATLDSAEASRDRAKAEDDAAKAAVAAAQVQVSTQKSLLDIQQENADLLKQQNDLLNQQARISEDKNKKELKGLADIAGALRGIGDAANGMGKLSAEALAKVEEVSKRVKDSISKIADAFGPVTEAWNKLFGYTIRKDMPTRGGPQEGFEGFEHVPGIIEKAFAPITRLIDEFVKENMPKVSEAVRTAAEEISNSWETAKTFFVNLNDFAKSNISTMNTLNAALLGFDAAIVVIGAIIIVPLAAAVAWQGLVGVIAAVGLALTGFFAVVTPPLLLVGLGIMMVVIASQKLGETIVPTGNVFQQIVVGALAAALAIGGLGTSIAQGVTSWIGDLELWQTISELKWRQVKTAWQGIWDNIQLIISVAFAELVIKVVKFITDVKTRWDTLKTDLDTKFKEIVTSLKDNLGKGFDWVRVNVLTPFAEALAGIKGWIDDLLEAARKLAEKLLGLKPSADLKPGSPTPFELGLRGIREEMSALSRMEVPQLTMRMAAMPGAEPQSTGSRQQIVNIYGLTLEGVQDRAGLLEQLQAYA